MSALKAKEKITADIRSMMGVLVANLGCELGIWSAIKDGRQVRASELAVELGLSERYLQELLRAAALHGYLTYTPGDLDTSEVRWDSGVPRDLGTFSLDAGMAEALLDTESEHYYGYQLKFPVSMAGAPYDRLMAAFKDDGGVKYSLFGTRCVSFIEASHKYLYLRHLPTWFQTPQLSTLRSSFEAGGTVVDIGCGVGWSSIAISATFPQLRVVAVDCDPESIRQANINIKASEESGLILPGNIETQCCMAHQLKIEPQSAKAAFLLICLHDMYNPSQVLKTAMELVSEAGCLLVLEYECLPDFPTMASQQGEQRMYCAEMFSASVLHCLPVSKAEPGSQAIGTCHTHATLRQVAQKAGISTVEVVSDQNNVVLYKLTR